MTARGTLIRIIDNGSLVPPIALRAHDGAHQVDSLATLEITSEKGEQVRIWLDSDSVHDIYAKLGEWLNAHGKADQ